MKLVRNGVFETNSSSAHSLAYGTDYILRGSRWYQSTEEHDFSNPMYRLDAVPDHYRNYTFYEWLGEFGWNGKYLRTPQEKFSYLLTQMADTSEELHVSTDYETIKEMVEDIGCEIVRCNDQDGYVDHESHGIVNPSLFKSKKDLITYLFNDNIRVYIENDNYEYQEWYTGEKHVTFGGSL